MNRLFARRTATTVAAVTFYSLAISFGGSLYAADPEPKGPERWKNEIERITAADAEKPPAKGGVLFLGSSSIRLWKLDESFPGQNYLNRGFGGSEISDSLHYLDQLVFAYEPKTIVFYAGDNDLAKKKKSPQRVAADFRELSERVAERLPQTRILYIAVKPSLQRWSLIEEVRAANEAIAKYCAETPNRTFIDIATPMLGEDGLPRKELFVADGLHMSPAGYEIWTKLVAAELEAEGTKAP
ncbi:MAG TPA: SGNH/GDSL hydrolase family protein [Pirellulaceae bacterium]|jgi:lysophospholipase L1-like esterase|nr:SGNH/GDSL hydrolase family protein [Pirellulaceae bacterium]